MSEFKKLILSLRDQPNKVEKIVKFVESNPVELSKMPDDTYVVSDGNHRANLLNLLNVDKIPSTVDGEFKLIPVEVLKRPNGSIGTQGFSSENMMNLLNHIFKKKKTFVDELFEDEELDQRIIQSFKPKDHLSDKIWDNESTLNPKIRKKLLEISDAFIEYIGVEFFVHDIIFTGSLSNYNWSEFSDIDLHILIDMDEFDSKKNTDSISFHNMMKEFFDSKKNLWNEKHNIKIKGYDVELYVQDVNEEHTSSGVYSILNNKWLVKPESTKESIDEKQIIKKGEEYAKQIDKLIKDSKNKNITKQVDDLRDKIKKFRKSGLETGGEYSYENLTFKLLRRNGYIEKLLNLKTSLTDKKLSLKEQ